MFVVFDDVRNENACGCNDKNNDDDEILANLLLLLILFSILSIWKKVRGKQSTYTHEYLRKLMHTS